MTRTLALIALAATLGAAPAYAQTSPTTPTTPEASASTGSAGYLAQEKPGQWRSGKLTGLSVYNGTNERIGDINELILGSNGQVEYVVVGVGGFLGLGEHSVAVPFKEVKFVMEPVKQAGAEGRKTETDTTASTSSGTASGNGRMTYPDHAMINATKDQLKAAPAFNSSK